MVLRESTDSSTWSAKVGFGRRWTDGVDREGDTMNTIEIYWSGVGLSYNGEHVRDGIRVISICATPVDDTRSDIFAGYWISEEESESPGDFEARLAAAKLALPDDIRIWEHQKYLEPPGLATFGGGGLSRAAPVGERVLSRAAGRSRTGHAWRLTARPRRTTPKSDRTRESILDAARTAFARKGFSGVTIRDITDLAAVTRANFYYYFSDKTELFIELGTDTYRQALAVVEGFMEQGSPPNREDIEAWVDGYFTTSTATVRSSSAPRRTCLPIANSAPR